MEVSYKSEVASLLNGEGEVMDGENVMAVVKGLLQSGVAYVGGYQGAPVSHILDVLADAKEDVLDSLGVYFESSASEAAAAAMLSASVNYPMRGAVAWKSVVGTNVAADPLSAIASVGVEGGALIIIGEDYGQGTSIIQERTHAFALKCTMPLLDPRPEQQNVVDMVEKGFQLSEASNMPVMLMLRIRAAHLNGSFVARDNVEPKMSRKHPFDEPAPFTPSRINYGPALFENEQDKVEKRLPAARRFIVENAINEIFCDDPSGEVGIILQGGLYNTLIAALNQLGLADAYGESRIPLFVLNATYPLVPEQITEFCATKRSVLIVEEGTPEYIEQEVNVFLRRADVQTKIYGKDLLKQAGEYTPELVRAGLRRYVEASRPAGMDAGDVAARDDVLVARITEVANRPQPLAGEAPVSGSNLPKPLPPRAPTFCTGCPERPFFTALKIVQRELGPTHVSGDIGCHTFAANAPFNLPNSTTGYGMGLSSAAAVEPASSRRTITVIGDGGMWHSGLTAGVAGAVYNKQDTVLAVINNGFTAATGQQRIPASGINHRGEAVDMDLGRALKGVGVEWVKTIDSYDLSKTVKTLREALTTSTGGVKAIIAKGECQLNRQRRVRPENEARKKAGKRVLRPRFGVDEDVCTGDRSCIRLSGCPSLTVKSSPDPLRDDPVAHVDNSCVGCGHCGEVAHAAVLCPAFYRADIIENPSFLERALEGWRRFVIGLLRRRPSSLSAAA